MVALYIEWKNKNDALNLNTADTYVIDSDVVIFFQSWDIINIEYSRKKK
jgi:hypothetical protein